MIKQVFLFWKKKKEEEEESQKAEGIWLRKCKSSLVRQGPLG